MRNGTDIPKHQRKKGVTTEASIAHRGTPFGLPLKIAAQHVSATPFGPGPQERASTTRSWASQALELIPITAVILHAFFLLEWTARGLWRVRDGRPALGNRSCHGERRNGWLP